MTLREEAEKAAIGGVCEYSGALCGACAVGEARPDCYGCELRDANISAMERVARAFAERALRGIMGCTEVHPRKYEAFISEAISAADRGEGLT